MCDPNILYVCPEYSEKLYPNKGKFTVGQLLRADMVKSAFSAGKRVEHMWVTVSKVQVENQLVKGTLDNTPTEITHLTFGDIVFVPFKEIEDIWIEGQVPESVKRLWEAKEDACMRALTGSIFLLSYLAYFALPTNFHLAGTCGNGARCCAFCTWVDAEPDPSAVK
jgi:hypothetical protein